MRNVIFLGHSDELLYIGFSTKTNIWAYYRGAGQNNLNFTLTVFRFILDIYFMEVKAWQG